MNHPYRAIAAFSILLLAASCREPIVEGRGPEKTEQRNVAGSFSNISIEAPVDTRIQIGGAPSFSITGYSNILPYIHTKVENNTLHVYLRDDADLTMRKNPVAVITVPSLNSLDLSGATEAQVTGDATGEELEIDMSGATSIVMASANVKKLTASMSGSSALTINGGTVGSASYDISGSGDVHAYNMQTSESSVEVSGSGSAEVSVSQKLDVDISGSGEVNYKGQPAINQNISGSGSVTNAN